MPTQAPASVLPEATTKQLTELVTQLAATFRENLVCCLLYGSAVRGDFDPGTSDLNLLIVLRASTPPAHEALAKLIAGTKLPIAPFVLSAEGLARSFHAFGPKFLSIRRNYRLLHGEDCLARYEVDSAQVRFLVEQSLRNGRLRAVNRYVQRGPDPDNYGRWLRHAIPRAFTEMSDALRCADIAVPHDHAGRIPALAREFGLSAAELEALLQFKHQPVKLSGPEALIWHTRLFTVLDHAVHWMEQRWPTPQP